MFLDSNLQGFASRTFDNIRVWFNNKGWAASVSYMNAVNNVVLRAGVKDAGISSPYSGLELAANASTSFKEKTI